MPENLLRRYRPVGPPLDLRSRILVPERPAWPWAVAAAALLALTVGFHAATSRLDRHDETTGSDLFDAHARIAFATDALGGGEDARRLAQWIVLEEELRQSLPAVAAAPVRADGAQ